jgi:hypothetical protein
MVGNLNNGLMQIFFLATICYQIFMFNKGRIVGKLVMLMGLNSFDMWHLPFGLQNYFSGKR